MWILYYKSIFECVSFFIPQTLILPESTHEAGVLIMYWVADKIDESHDLIRALIK